MAAEATRLFDGAHLRATVFHPVAPIGQLVVTFRHRIPEPGAFDTPSPIRRFLGQGWTHLHIQSRLNDWYVNADTRPLCDVLAGFTERFHHVAGIGFSMGAYACLRLSAALTMTEAVAISPQYSIHPDVVPFDRRFRAEAAGFDRDLGDLGRHACLGLRGALIFDPFRPLDLRNAEMIGAVLPGVALCRYAFGGHPATGVLRDTVKFAAIQDLVLGQRLQRAPVLALHRANRAGSASWWRALAAKAEKTGRPRLARAALARLPA
jgi:hypothetical protein